MVADAVAGCPGGAGRGDRRSRRCFLRCGGRGAKIGIVRDQLSPHFGNGGVARNRLDAVDRLHELFGGLVLERKNIAHDGVELIPFLDVALLEDLLELFAGEVNPFVPGLPTRRLTPRQRRSNSQMTGLKR